MTCVSAISSAWYLVSLSSSHFFHSFMGSTLWLQFHHLINGYRASWGWCRRYCVNNLTCDLGHFFWALARADFPSRHSSLIHGLDVWLAMADITGPHKHPLIFLLVKMWGNPFPRRAIFWTEVLLSGLIAYDIINTQHLRKNLFLLKMMVGSGHWLPKPLPVCVSFSFGRKFLL